MPEENQEKLRFGTVGAPKTNDSVSGSVESIAHSRALGFGHYEIAWVYSVRVSDSTCAEIKAATGENDITLTIHAPYAINLNSQTDDLMQASDERLLAAARAGWKSGAEGVVFHPGSYHEQPPEEVYARIRDKLAELAGKLRDEGVAITLRPETMGKVAVFGTLEEILQLSAEVEGVLPCIDFAHLQARSAGKFNGYDDFRGALDRVGEVLGDEGLVRLHGHISGIAFGERGEQNHLPLNEASLDYAAVLRALIDVGAAGTLAVEAPDPFHVADAMTIQATYRRLLEDVP